MSEEIVCLSLGSYKKTHNSQYPEEFRKSRKSQFFCSAAQTVIPSFSLVHLISFSQVQDFSFVITEAQLVDFWTTVPAS